MAKGTTIPNANTQWRKVNAELEAAKPSVSNEMKMRMALSMKCTTRTIETYLSGQGKKLPFAVDLLKAVKEEIKGIREAA